MSGCGHGGHTESTWSPYCSPSVWTFEGEEQTTIHRVNIEDFYSADERRRSSREVEFGRDWRDSQNVRYELSWVEDTGELYLMREPVPGAYEDPFGDIVVDKEDLDGLLVSVLGVVASHEKVEEVLAGWTQAMANPAGVEWLATTLKAAGIVE